MSEEENTRPQSHSEDSYPTNIELSELRKFALTGFTLCLLYEGVALASKADIGNDPIFIEFISALRSLAMGDNENFWKSIRNLDKQPW